jgi:hypothetical protein
MLHNENDAMTQGNLFYKVLFAHKDAMKSKFKLPPGF